jgi:formylglycine-generating enzyme required for sulfatase activity
MRLVLAALVGLAPFAAAAEERLCGDYAGVPASSDPTAGAIWIAGRTFIMGDDDERSEERVEHEVTVSGFWIDRHEVTNAQFARFVAATGYRTLAERGLDAKDHPGVPPELLAPGSIVFSIPDGIVNLVDVRQWWRFVPGADWRHPLGPGSSIEGKESHPVVDVAL